MDGTNSSTTKPLYRGTQIVWYIVGFLDALLAFRFLLKLFGANPSAGFTSAIYSVTQPFAAPFLSVFQITRVEGSTLEWTTILAIIVYSLIGMAAARLLVIGKTVSTSEAAAKLDDQDR